VELEIELSWSDSRRRKEGLIRRLKEVVADAKL
jgi:hypothetical protein